MRPSSSRSEPGEPATAGGLFGPSFTSPAVERALSDAALLRAMLAAEAALARASCQAGRAPAEAAEAIARVCAEAEFDLDELGRQAANVANPVEPLTRALASRLPPDAARHVHAGATSQDILDTATSLLAKRASELILADLRALTWRPSLAGPPARWPRSTRTGRVSPPTTPPASALPNPSCPGTPTEPESRRWPPPPAWRPGRWARSRWT